MTKLLAAMALLVAACGGNDSVEFEDFWQELRDGFCRNFVKCGVVEDLDTCRDLNLDTPVLEAYWFASEQAAFDMEKLVFHGDKAQDCADAFADASCDFAGEARRALLEMGPFPDACREVITGALGAGETCTFGAECRSLRCNVPPCDMACCSGTCVGDTPPVLAKVGESCLNSACVSAAYCEGPGAICAALKPLNATCNSLFECALDLTCIQSGDDVPRCGKLPALGEECQDFCQDLGVACSLDTGTCVEAGLAGDPCMDNLDCSPAYVCDATSRCSGGLALGETCQPTDLCRGQLAFCDAATSQCSLPKADGMTCAANDQCVSRTCSAGQCIPEPVCI